MKKRIYLLSLAFGATVMFAQEVRLPELPNNRTHYTEPVGGINLAHT